MKTRTSERGNHKTGGQFIRQYGMIAYRLSDRLQVGSYYSVYFPDVRKRDSENKATSQQDIAACLRIDINEHWLVKLEGHFMNGTADLARSENPDPAKTKANWALFMAKTTVTF